jgi:FdhD protein
VSRLDIIRIDKSGRKNYQDEVSDEIPLTIHLDGKELLTLLCSPESLKEFSAGFLYSAGIIKSINDINTITIDSQRWISHVELKNKTEAAQFMFKRMYTSGCGRGVLFYNTLDLLHRRKINSNLKIHSAKITELMASFQNSSTAFKQTGGVHSCALSDGENILIFKEDIGRHNALDKVIGEALFKGLDMRDFVVLTSGRVSSEIVLKAGKTRSPFLISRSAPTDQAVKLSKDLNLTLIGFVRGERMNVYAGQERIIYE